MLTKKIPNYFPSPELVISLFFKIILQEVLLLPITFTRVDIGFSWNHLCKIIKSNSRPFFILFLIFSWFIKSAFTAIKEYSEPVISSFHLLKEELIMLLWNLLLRLNSKRWPTNVDKATLWTEEIYTISGLTTPWIKFLWAGTSWTLDPHNSIKICGDPENVLPGLWVLLHPNTMC